MKRILSALLVTLMLLPLTVSAAPAFPESDHIYPNNSYVSYEYSIPNAKGMLITFSSDTWVEPSGLPDEICVCSDAQGEITLENVLQTIEHYKRGDYLFLYNADGSLIDAYQGDELAGQTVFVSGDRVKIVLYSDDSVSGYGFRITAAKSCSEELLAQITYVTGLDAAPSYQKLYYLGESSYLDKGVRTGSISQSKAGFTGWTTQPDGDIRYDGGEAVTSDMDGMTLYARWADPLLTPDEIFLFNNSQTYFTAGENGGYYLTDEALLMLERNIFSVFGPSPVPAAILGAVLYTYPNWSWKGSCYGMSTVTFLQHYGVINVLPMQNAGSMNDMVLDDKLKSVVNYYQAQAATSWLCENKAAIAGSRSYAACMKDLYETVERGKIAMLTFYEGAAFVTSGHTVLVTDVYTNAKGEHILIVYDNNHPWRYTNGMTDRFVISPDWRTAVDDYGDATGAINWTATTSQFEAFDINGNGRAVTWHRTWVSHEAEVLRRVCSLLRYPFC